MGRNILINIKRIFLILLIFSLPFEYWDPFGIASFFTVTKMAGFGYAAFAFFTKKDSFDLSVFKYVKYLLVFWIILTFLNLFNYTSTNTVSIFNFTLLQNILLYWLIASDLIRGNIQSKNLMLSFILSVLLMNLLISFGVGVGNEYEEGISRLSFFGNNSNTVGIISGLAIVFSLYFILNPSKTYGKWTFFLIIGFPIFINILLLSGSRGALITVILSVILMFLANKTTLFKKGIQIGLLVLLASYLNTKIIESEMMYNRMVKFLEEGDLANRGDIWEDVLEISLHRPLIGYGATGFENEIRKYYGTRKSAHNLFLEIFVTTGLIGLAIFMYFLFFHIKKSFQYLRQGEVIKIVLLIFYLTTVVKSGGVINSKIMWMLLAVILAGMFFDSNKKYILQDENPLLYR